jgi:hypothetical protein
MALVPDRFQIQFLIEPGNPDDATFLDGITQPLAGFRTASQRRVPEQVEAANVAVVLHQHDAL